MPFTLFTCRFHRSTGPLLSSNPCAADIRQRFPSVLPGSDKLFNDLFDIPGDRFHESPEVFLKFLDRVFIPLDGPIPINTRATVFGRGHAFGCRAAPDHFHLFRRNLEIHDVLSRFTHFILPSHQACGLSRKISRFTQMVSLFGLPYQRLFIVAIHSGDLISVRPLVFCVESPRDRESRANNRHVRCEMGIEVVLGKSVGV
jgi:hypothetical protein